MGCRDPNWEWQVTGSLQQEFVPALGWPALTPAYDAVVRLLTREERWRGAFLRQIAPVAGDNILDVGCGTGSLAILMKQAAPGARIVGLDPDADVLARAATKAAKAGVEIEWRQGFAGDAAALGERFDKAVSSLVFHQVPLAGKVSGVASMVDAVRPGGEVHIADFARQRSRTMRALFGLVGRLDGVENTRPNADGAIERILGDISTEAAEPTQRVATPLGEISLFLLRRSAPHRE